MPKAAKNMESLSFEEILSQLEAIVERLEVGDAPLADALATFETGVGLARQGATRLDEAERRIDVLLKDSDPPGTRPMTDKEPAFDE